LKPKVAIIAGTRPEAVKVAPICQAMARSSRLEPVLISTGQHREMLRQTLEAFELQPAVDLAVMEPNQTLVSLTGKLLAAISDWLRREKPAAMLVQGDTTSAFVSALAGFYAGVPVGHVEAGLRTYDFSAPWPEELNRRLTAPIARWHFAPTALAQANLLAERIPAASVSITGNTVIDALLWMKERQDRRTESAAERLARCGVPPAFLARYFDPGKPAPWILVTGHRRESFGAGFDRICEALARMVVEYPNLGLIFPVHLNPRVREPVLRLLGGNPHIALIEPLAYEDFVWMMSRCHFLLSDSGGVQEEAPSLGKPVLVMRTTTERPEGIEAGTSRLVGTDPAAILREAGLLLRDPAEYASRAALRNPYGDGQAAARIVATLERDLAPISNA